MIWLSETEALHLTIAVLLFFLIRAAGQILNILVVYLCAYICIQGSTKLQNFCTKFFSKKRKKRSYDSHTMELSFSLQKMFEENVVRKFIYWILSDKICFYWLRGWNRVHLRVLPSRFLVKRKTTRLDIAYGFPEGLYIRLGGILPVLSM